jgi:DNA-3-methyladenine glycosylase II
VLTPIKGIGRWTVEMLLMFSLNRPDVWPIDDLGLQESVRVLYGLPARPKARELQPLGEKWRPYRTIASWYLWRAKEG